MKLFAYYTADSLALLVLDMWVRSLIGVPPGPVLAFALIGAAVGVWQWRDRVKHARLVRLLKAAS